MAGFDFDVKIEGFEEVQKALYSDKLQKIAGDMLKMAAIMTEGKAREGAPSDKGILRNSITHKIYSDHAIVGTNIEYGKYQEYGTGIYGKTGQPIRPKNSKFLVFKGKDGSMVFAREVKGVPAKKFMEGAVKYLKANIKKVTDFGSGAVLKEMFNFR